MTLCTVCGRISEGVPPPKKIERTDAAGRDRGAMGEFGAQRGDEALLVDRRGAHMGVEIAIGALGQTERPMHVNAKAGIGAVGASGAPASGARVSIEVIAALCQLAGRRARLFATLGAEPRSEGGEPRYARIL